MDAPKEAPEGAAASSSGGGIKAMLPLILNLVLMPVVAYALTTFVLLPKLRAPGAAHAAATEAAEGHDAEEGHGEAEEKPGDAHGGGHGEAKDAHGGGEAKDAHGGGGKASKVPVPLGAKILVNVAGTQGTRYLQANISLVSNKAGLKDMVEKYDAQLRDAAAGTLAAKTISDLERPGARNLVRTELLGVFNTILGAGTVSDLFLTEFAIQ